MARRPGELDLPSSDDKRRAVEEMFDRIAPRYDPLNGLITLGLHKWWKRAAMHKRIRVLTQRLSMAPWTPHPRIALASFTQITPP